MAENLPARDVVVLGALEEVSSRGLIDEAAIDRAFADAVQRLEVRPDDGSLLAGAFSGGNQQKLVVARELRAGQGRAPRFVLAAQPTRGVDVRVAAAIQRALVEAARGGAAVLLVSSDLDELRAISDRILVLRSGAIAATFPPDTPVATLGEAMLA